MLFVGGSEKIASPADPGYDDGVVLETYSTSSLLQRWELTKCTTQYNGVNLITKRTSILKNDNFTYKAIVYSSNVNENGQNGITWSVTNGTGSATIDAQTGLLTGVSTGDVTVTATYSRGTYYTPWTDECVVTVYLPAVLLIHGRIDNSFVVWGANNGINVNPLNPDIKINNHFDSNINASTVGTKIVSYTNILSQQIYGYAYNTEIYVPAVFNGKYPDCIEDDKPHPEGGNLAYYLVQQGYTPNVDLFVFNYPNEDAVKYNAYKLNAYLENLATDIRTNGTNQEKLSFFGKASNLTATTDYNINIVGHSMGGLVARYYIENIGKDENVDKLITICTPHWGSFRADTSNSVGAVVDEHKLCDHDLSPNSAMYGGSKSVDLDCDVLGPNCCNSPYTLTDELDYSSDRQTKYYAIAGVNKTIAGVDGELDFEIDPNFETYGNIANDMIAAHISFEEYDLTALSDNIVGFYSQIGCTENDGEAPSKKIEWESIYLVVDANGGNSLQDSLHVKMPHRANTLQKITEYLQS